MKREEVARFLQTDKLKQYRSYTQSHGQIRKTMVMELLDVIAFAFDEGMLDELLEPMTPIEEIEQELNE